MLWGYQQVNKIITCYYDDECFSLYFQFMLTIYTTHKTLRISSFFLCSISSKRLSKKITTKHILCICNWVSSIYLFNIYHHSMWITNELNETTEKKQEAFLSCHAYSIRETSLAYECLIKEYTICHLIPTIFRFFFSLFLSLYLFTITLYYTHMCNLIDMYDIYIHFVW